MVSVQDWATTGIVWELVPLYVVGRPWLWTQSWVICELLLEHRRVLLLRLLPSSSSSWVYRIPNLLAINPISPRFFSSSCWSSSEARKARELPFDERLCLNRPTDGAMGVTILALSSEQSGCKPELRLWAPFCCGFIPSGCCCAEKVCRARHLREISCLTCLYGVQFSCGRQCIKFTS